MTSVDDIVAPLGNFFICKIQNGRNEQYIFWANYHTENKRKYFIRQIMYSYQEKMIVDIIILDIALWVNPRWPPFGRGQTINLYNYRRKRSRLTIFMSRVLMYAPPSGVVRNNLRHYTVLKIQNGHHLFKVKQ